MIFLLTFRKGTGSQQMTSGYLNQQLQLPAIQEINLDLTTLGHLQGER